MEQGRKRRNSGKTLGDWLYSFVLDVKVMTPFLSLVQMPLNLRGSRSHEVGKLSVTDYNA